MFSGGDCCHLLLLVWLQAQNLHNHAEFPVQPETCLIGGATQLLRGYAGGGGGGGSELANFINVYRRRGADVIHDSIVMVSMPGATATVQQRCMRIQRLQCCII